MPRRTRSARRSDGLQVNGNDFRLAKVLLGFPTDHGGSGIPSFVGQEGDFAALHVRGMQ